MRIKYLLFIFLILSQSAFSGSAPADLSAKLQAIQSYQADFVQVVTMPNQAPRKSDGHFTLKKPGRFLWSIVHPEAQKMIADGKRFWVYDVDLEQVTVQPLKQGGDDFIWLLLSHDITPLLGRYNIEHKKTTFLLTPRDESSLLESVLLNFDKSHFSGVRLTGINGVVTQIRFSQIKQNQAIKNDLFEFTPPVGVDIIGDVQ